MKEINGYTRVTDVLFRFSGLQNIDQNVLKRAAQRGEYVHEKCDAIIKGLETYDENQSNNDWYKYVTSFMKWYPKPFINRPERFFCDKYMITGECDGVYEENGKLVLVDFKTSARESKTWKLQGSAYSYMAKNAGYDIARIEFVKLSKDSSVPVVYAYEEDFNTFVKCLEMFRMFFKESDTSEFDYI